ncbi:hypothetical protein OKW30_003557 [Paraburkholderia sp. Clong3]|uniref:hypothetical protein n=1 Tax=Paraburkholderia sp. Clong3 TaxID=2991061 RepID=UPI003D222BDF
MEAQGLAPDEATDDQKQRAPHADTRPARKRAVDRKAFKDWRERALEIGIDFQRRE